MSEGSVVPVAGPWMAIITGTSAVPKAIAKLIDTVGEQIGLFLEPRHIRRKGQAEADVLIADARASADIAIIRATNKHAVREVNDRALERIRRREEKRQRNLEAITSQAAQHLPDSVSDEPVNEDWLAHFFECCQDVGNEQMQTVWSKLLAGEVGRPGSFSPRALQAVRLMSRGDANLFTKFCTSVWRDHDSEDWLPLMQDYSTAPTMRAVSIEFTELRHLASIGLIVLFDGPNFSVEPDESTIRWSYFGKLHVLTYRKPDQPKVSWRFVIGRSLLSEIGKELVPIAGATPNEAYRQAALEWLNVQGWEESATTDNSSPEVSS